MRILSYIREIFRKGASLEEGDTVFYYTISGKMASGRVLKVRDHRALVKSLWMGSIITQWISTDRLRLEPGKRFWL